MQITVGLHQEYKWEYQQWSLTQASLIIRREKIANEVQWYLGAGVGLGLSHCCLVPGQRSWWAAEGTGNEFCILDALEKVNVMCFCLLPYALSSDHWGEGKLTVLVSLGGCAILVWSISRAHRWLLWAFFVQRFTHFLCNNWGRVRSVSCSLSINCPAHSSAGCLSRRSSPDLAGRHLLV